MGLSAHPARMLASSTEKGLCFRSFLASAKAAGWVRMLSWDDFRYVKAIAEAQSLAGAGEHLGVNHSTVFRRLGQIEQHLGSRLFERGRAGYALTPCGTEMVDLAERMFQEISASSAGSPAMTCGLRGSCGSPPATSSSGTCSARCSSSPRLSGDHPLTKRDADVAVRAAYQAVFGAAAPGADRSCATASPQNLR
jgi:hypothetical protein